MRFSNINWYDGNHELYVISGECDIEVPDHAVGLFGYDVDIYDMQAEDENGIVFPMECFDRSEIAEINDRVLEYAAEQDYERRNNF